MHSWVATLRIAEHGDYIYQGPRFTTIAPSSGEQFRDEILIPWLEAYVGSTCVIDFAQTEVFAPGFMGECFGGAVRRGFTQLCDMDFVNIPGEETKRVQQYMKEARKFYKKISSS